MGHPKLLCYYLRYNFLFFFGFLCVHFCGILSTFQKKKEMKKQNKIKQKHTQNTHGVHGAPLGADCLKEFKEKMGFDPSKNFVIDKSVIERYESTFGKRGQQKYDEWNKMLQEYTKAYPKEAAEFKRTVAGELPKDWEQTLPKFDENSKVFMCLCC